ncbi:MAG: hypothetical protein RL708_562 [Bacteroidota bacterium]|jgi:hypothetical protein
MRKQHYFYFFILLAVFITACNSIAQQTDKHKAEVVVQYKSPFKAPKITSFNMNSPTIDLQPTLDSSFIGCWANINKDKDIWIVEFYTKNLSFYYNAYIVNPYLDSLNFSFSKQVDLVTKNKLQYLFLKSGPCFFGFSESDTLLFKITQDSFQTNKIYFKINTLYQIINEMKHYRTNCRQNDSSTLFRWSYNGSFTAVFRLYRDGNDYYLQTYDHLHQLSDDKLIPSAHTLGTRYDYADANKNKTAGEYFVVKSQDTILLLIDATTNTIHQTGNLIHNWRYEYSRLDSAWFHY